MYGYRVVGYFDSASFRRVSTLGLQQQLGLWTKRITGTDPVNRSDPRDHGTYTVWLLARYSFDFVPKLTSLIEGRSYHVGPAHRLDRRSVSVESTETATVMLSSPQT